MKVTIDDKTIQIVFLKEHAEHNDGRDKLNTRCYLYRISPDDNVPNRVLFGTGSAYLNFKDTYSKVKGKKIALARALKTTTWSFLSKKKKHREIIWDRFKKEFNIDQPEKSAE